MKLGERFRVFWNKPSHIAYLFIAPVMILLVTFSIIPMIASFFLSTFDADIFLNDIKFIGCRYGIHMGQENHHTPYSGEVHSSINMILEAIQSYSCKENSGKRKFSNRWRGSSG